VVAGEKLPDRTKQTAHYVIARALPERLGAVKLNKSMWVADLISYQQLGHTITGQNSYKKLRLGPVPNGIVTYLKELIVENKIFRREAPTMAGMRHEYVWLEQPDISVFTGEEIDILNLSIDWVCNNHSAQSISEFTHDVLWECVIEGEQIPVKAAIVTTKKANKKQLDWAKSVVAERRI
jgi:hypothetical protein